MDHGINSVKDFANVGELDSKYFKLDVVTTEHVNSETMCCELTTKY